MNLVRTVRLKIGNGSQEKRAWLQKKKKEDGGKATKAAKKRTDGKAHKAAEKKGTLLFASFPPAGLTWTQDTAREKKKV